MAAEVPGLGAYARTAVRLHPRPGNPGARDSHIGGPLLWPAGEPWPHCAEPEDRPPWIKGLDAPNALVSVAQLRAADFPELAFPDGADLLQILWCPTFHPHNGYQPEVRVVWRRGADVTDVLAAPPAPARAEDGYVPRPCVLHPERVTEYPWHEELPGELRARLHAWEETREEPADYQSDLSVVPGCKVGGGMAWPVTDMPPQECPHCAGPIGLLLQLDSTEWDGAGRWRPVEDADDAEPTGLSIARHSHLGIFRCERGHAFPLSQ
ncbi:hypothetical protein ACRB68_53180 [Actinomadura sp. RB68]|uniref:DUF1963 domain-containing protein n=2 Tax=Actinomadura macrotermitis TaxID=2585200 RepID=A0A7K0C177_9ACTN|nr:hypothetical protein [Actinomadura macrotermitis]